MLEELLSSSARATGLDEEDVRCGLVLQRETRRPWRGGRGRTRHEIEHCGMVEVGERRDDQLPGHGAGREQAELDAGRRPLPEVGRPARGGWRRGDRAGSPQCVRVCAAAGGERRGERGSVQSVVRARVRKLVRAAGP